VSVAELHVLLQRGTVHDGRFFVLTLFEILVAILKVPSFDDIRIATAGCAGDNQQQAR
jgi:hypothetical protein